MSGTLRLYEKIRRNPANVRFAQIIKLAEESGFIEARVSGSHHIFRHSEHRGAVLNLQDHKGRAKPYQVRQLLALVEEYRLLEE
ncbi:MAG: type II toxin-antitoxin system HicA family toxin [Thermoleophilia bacterium]